MTWEWKLFARLTPSELYDALALRQTVFVVEQRCPYLDADGRDRNALHLLGRDESGILVAYLRLLPPGSRFPQASIGRVVVAPTHRGRGLGRQLMVRALEQCGRDYPGEPLALSAQQYLEQFYASLGFVPTGEPYDEDGIPHIDMIRP